jgi:hypothetical protein
MTTRQPGAWGATGLIGQGINGAQGEDIGRISELLVDQRGRVLGVVIDVGDYLGVADAKVAVPIQALQFEEQASDKSATTGTVGSTPPSTASQPTTSTGDQRIPSHVVLIITKDELQAAPKFHESPQSEAGPNTTAPPTDTGKSAPQQ